MQLSKKTVELAAGEEYKISFTNEPKGARIKSTYHTDSNYITVSKNGIVRAKNYPSKTAKVIIKAKVISKAGKKKNYKFTLTVKITGDSTNNIDYPDAESFEAALNRGEDLKGKTVVFIVKKLVPNSAFGYNMQAGEHLNFCSPTNPNKRTGDKACVRVVEVISFLGSYIIYYDNLK